VREVEISVSMSLDVAKALEKLLNNQIEAIETAKAAKAKGQTKERSK
jgi:hypothetical protein